MCAKTQQQAKIEVLHIEKRKDFSSLKGERKKFSKIYITYVFDILFRHFHAYSGTFSNIQPCSSILRDIKALRHIETYVTFAYTNVPYSEPCNIFLEPEAS